MTRSSIQLKAILGMATMALLALGAVFFVSRPIQVNGSTLAFAVPHVATSSLMVVGPLSAVTILPKDAACVNRVVTTYANPIMISFSPTFVPNATQGHLQAASTTAIYNNGDFGCSAMTAYGYNASTSITVSEFAQ